MDREAKSHLNSALLAVFNAHYNDCRRIARLFTDGYNEREIRRQLELDLHTFMFYKQAIADALENDG